MARALVLPLAAAMIAAHGSTQPAPEVPETGEVFLEKADEHESRDLASDSNSTQGTTNVMGIYDTRDIRRLLAGSEQDLPDYLKSGRCCYWNDRFGRKMTRWFYYITRKSNGKNSISSVWQCPGKWKVQDAYYCNGAGAYNKNGYKEDTDWVMCCKKRESKVEYKYFSGEECKESSYTFTPDTCSSYECTDEKDVDGNDVKCQAGHDKLVNKDATKLCEAQTDPYHTDENPKYEVKKPEGHDFTDMMCAGYSNDCKKNFCIGKSMTYGSYGHTEDDRDCTMDCLDKYNPQPSAASSAAFGFAMLVAMLGITF